MARETFCLKVPHPSTHCKRRRLKICMNVASEGGHLNASAVRRMKKACTKGLNEATDVWHNETARGGSQGSGRSAPPTMTGSSTRPLLAAPANT